MLLVRTCSLMLVYAMIIIAVHYENTAGWCKTAGQLTVSHALSARHMPVNITSRTCGRCVRVQALELQPPSAAPMQPALCSLPGDPSVVVFTNVAFGNKKPDFMKSLSAAVASSLSKPESYVTVCVMDEQSLLFGGTDAPCAIAQLNSLGAINLSNNRSFSQAFSALIAEHGIPEDRYYINFFDVPRDNCGYKGATFAG